MRICTIIIVLASVAGAEEAPRFNRDVRPILSAKCFACHGPDARARKADLRLDDRAAALAHGAIVAGAPEKSAVIERITTADPNDRMPPASSELTLSPQDIDVLKRWIAAGAEYEPHWAFVPPPDIVPLPVIQDPERWARTSIDAYVMERLNREGLVPTPSADKETLLRRVTLDLTGLPPTVEELDNFLADDAPGAFERCVDRLLASPAYGERMALDWMDAARYADTFGYQADVEMDVWPWRDWVIAAFNNNLPYSDFITWQLAGDLLPNPTREQRLATAFNRLHRQTNEGGSINEEFRSTYVSDRTETFATAFLGLTSNCAKCHDHKFDPISQKDYYSLSAFFANIDESGLYSHFTRTSPAPALLLYKDGEEEKHLALKMGITQAEEALAAAEHAAADAPVDAARAVAPVVSWPFDHVDNNTTPDAATAERKANLVLAPERVEGREKGALRFTGDNGVEQGDGGDFERWQPFSFSFWLKLDAIAPRAVVLHKSKAETDAASRGWELLLIEGRPQFSLIHFWPGNAIRVLAEAPLETGKWVHLAGTYDGSSRAAGLKLYVDGTPIATSVVRDHLYKTIRYEGGSPPLTLAQRFRDSGLKGMVDDVHVYDAELSQLEVRALAHGQGVAEELATLRATPQEEAAPLLAEFQRLRVDAATLAARVALAQARKAESDFVETVRTIMTMEEMPQPRETRILTRGAYDHPADAVTMDTPHALPPFPEGAPRNRLGLAQWLTDPHHPLTARVAVNRYWQIFFGRGLVETQEDFGSQGRVPTHPELLDYLARRFIDSGWNVKALCKEIALSATYQQDSGASAELRARDPYNALLARGPRFRLGAEQIRDSALAASGLLTRTIGGPSVKPYQPAGLWEDAASASYTQDTGPALYRRGLYTFIKRTVPPPSTLTFDAGTRETCMVRRERTTTPLQALVLLNDPQYVEAARVLAERSVVTVPDAGQRLVHVFRALTSRTPDEAERTVLAKAFDEQRAWYAEHPEDALKFARAGAAAPMPELDPVDIAATTAVAQAIMNLDDFQMRR